ncbi:MAG: HAD-IB family phosphatase [Gemmatimonadetes bacterium]|nr:HAD-IB family phosphatase [Gemmatimonadota bacterium]
MPRYRTVVFDCDSTLSAIEGITELAGERRDELVALTEAAMRGDVPLEQVYGRRLALVRPSRAQVDGLGGAYIRNLLPRAREVVAALRQERIAVRIVAGGLRPAVLALARELGVEDDAVAAVDVAFDAAGNYAGFDQGSPLAYAGGKRDVLARWAPALPRPILLVGDGATDLEARPVVDGFVAFAGVIERAAVAASADVVVRSRSLAPILALALGEEPPRDPGARVVYDEGLTLLQREGIRIDPD